jgi:hypothetical protein
MFTYQGTAVYVLSDRYSTPVSVSLIFEAVPLDSIAGTALAVSCDDERLGADALLTDAHQVAVGFLVKLNGHDGLFGMPLRVVTRLPQTTVSNLICGGDDDFVTMTCADPFQVPI